MSTDPFRHSDICGILAVVAAALLLAASATASFAAAPSLATALTAGEGYSCALTTAGGVKCWGDNANGPLGDGTTTNRVTPIDVVGLTVGVQSVAAGHRHTCAITATGGAKCWGENSYGKLGDGTTTSRSLPTDVAGLGSAVTAIAGGGGHTCALTAGGGVKCWGNNSSGQLGVSGGTPPYLTPQDVASLASGVTAVLAGGYHTCALTMGGGVKCWGANLFGEIGDGTRNSAPVPTDVFGLGSGVAAIALGGDGGTHTCALTVGGAVKCWGRNTFGQLGVGTAISYSLTPRDVVGLASGVAAIVAGNRHTCALTTGGGVKCWGDNTFGQLGDSSTDYRNAPVDVTGLASGIAAIAAGQYHTCAVTTLGGVKCWGNNEAGALGDGTLNDRRVQVDVYGMNDADNDGIPNDVETAEGRNPLVKDNDVFAIARLFAMQQYRDFLFREGDPIGVSGWSGDLGSGAVYRERVVDSFVTSLEFSDVVAPVVRLYFACFQRTPDYDGLVFNARLLRDGKVSREYMATHFAGSPEFLATYGTLDNTQFVTRLYQNVLGRAPDPAGLSGWVAMLDGGAPRGRVVLGFSDSPEFQGLIANEVFATMIYVGMLKRSPDPTGFSLWVSYLDSGPYLHEQAINAILLSAEYHARFLP